MTAPQTFTQEQYTQQADGEQRLADYYRSLGNQWYDMLAQSTDHGAAMLRFAAGLVAENGRLKAEVEQFPLVAREARKNLDSLTNLRAVIQAEIDSDNVTAEMSLRCIAQAAGLWPKGEQAPPAVPDLESRLRHWAELNDGERKRGYPPTLLRPETVLKWLGVPYVDRNAYAQIEPFEPDEPQGEQVAPVYTDVANP